MMSNKKAQTVTFLPLDAAKGKPQTPQLPRVPPVLLSKRQLHAQEKANIKTPASPTDEETTRQKQKHCGWVSPATDYYPALRCY